MAKKKIVYVDACLLGDDPDFKQKKPVVQSDSEDTKPKGPLFDMIGDIFVNPQAFLSYSKESIKQNAFMINRVMSIMYPIEASYLSKKMVSPYAMYFLWNQALYNGRRKEAWVYTKGAKKTKEECSIGVDITKAQIAEFCMVHNIDLCDFERCMQLWPDEAIQDVKEYEREKVVEKE